MLGLRAYKSKMDMNRRLTMERTAFSMLNTSNAVVEMAKAQSYSAKDNSPEKKAMVEYLRNQRRKLRKADWHLEIRKRPSRPAKIDAIHAAS